jgi:hypothetical protein
MASTMYWQGQCRHGIYLLHCIHVKLGSKLTHNSAIYMRGVDDKSISTENLRAIDGRQAD